MRRTKGLALFFGIAGALLILAGIAASFVFPVTPLNDSVSSQTLYFSRVRSLTVITGTLPIRVEPAEGEVCEVSFVSDLPVVASVDEFGTLRLTQDDDFSLTFFSRRRSGFHLTVKLPARVYERISLASSSGGIDCAAVDCASLEISTRSGSITLDGADERAKLRTESGTVDLTLSGLNGGMTVTAGSGDVRLRVREGLSYCLRFLTEKGTLYEAGSGEEPPLGDAALFRGAMTHRLDILTADGDLYYSEFSDGSGEDADESGEKTEKE